MPDSLGSGGPKAANDRPSFTGFWKRSKDQQAAQGLTFVSSKLGQPSARGQNEGQTEPSKEAKAKERRQQVRKAQRQHRQRKANYTKQLEMDITKLRDDIAKVEEDVKRLKSQNGVMRSQLASGAGDGGGGHDPVTSSVAVDVLPPLPPPAVMDTMDTAFSTFLAPNYTISLDMSEFLGTPAYQVRRASSSAPDSSGGGSKATTTTSPQATETFSATTTPASTAWTSPEDVAMMEATLSEEQVDRAINFILALEHCCWDHVDQTCFHHSHSHQQPRDWPAEKKPCPGALAALAMEAMDDDEAQAEDDAALNGHALTATALALQSAPTDIFARINDLSPPAAAASATVPGVSVAQKGPPSSPVEWQSQALTLTNLRLLARSLNDSDCELAPVQAWFELVSLYGVGVATDADVLRSISRELAGEVQCVEFGASIQRAVFEDVLERVVGFIPRSWDGVGFGEEMDMLLDTDVGDGGFGDLGIGEGTGQVMGIGRLDIGESADLRSEGPYLAG